MRDMSIVFPLCHWGVRWGRRFNVSMVRREGNGTEQLVGEGRAHMAPLPSPPRQPEMDRPPTRDKFPQFYINSPSPPPNPGPDGPLTRASRSRSRSSQEVSEPASEPTRQHKYSISPTYCYSNYPSLLCFPLPAPRWNARWMDRRWMVDTRGMGLLRFLLAPPPSDFS